MTGKRIFTLGKTISETADVKTFHLIPADNKRFKFKAGQFVNLFLDDICRPYSISSSPANENFVELTIKMIKGKMTSKLETLKAGDKVEIAGPFGDFSFDSQELVMISCGIGIPPMMSQLREIFDKRLKKKITLFYSSRTRRDMLFRDELDRIQRDCPQLKIIYIITRENIKGCECRRFDLEMLKKYVENPAGKKYLVCGPAELRKNVSEIFGKLKIPAENLKIECWG